MNSFSKIISKWYVMLFAIVLIAAFLRFYQLGINPPALTWDEAAWGYNAYALGADARDEFGRFMPHDYLESFGDFKPPMYAYLTIVPVKLIGLNEFATRFPSAFFGLLTVIMSYFLVKQIFYKSAHKNKYALLTAFLLAISPWHIMLSRAAFEANVATFFTVCGVWLYLKAMHENMWYLSVSAIFFVASVYTFNTPRLAAPILIVLLSLLFIKKLLKNKKQAIVACIIGIALLLPTFSFLLSPQAALRYDEVNIFSDLNVIKVINQEVANDHNSKLSKIIHNRRIVFSVDFLQHYFDEFNFNFLFINGDPNPKFSSQDVGEMYFAYIPFFLLGILLLIRRKESNWWLVFLWLLVGLIPASTSQQTPHALRIEFVIPMFEIIVAYGIIQCYLYLSGISKKNKLPLFFTSCIFLFVLALNVTKFIHGYYTFYPKDFSQEWQYGYKQSIAYVASVQGNYDQINITDSLGRPYIYYLFYLKTPPSEFRKTAYISRDTFGFVHVLSFDKYYFGSNLSSIASKNQSNLYIDIPMNVPKNAHVLKTFYNLDKTPALVAYII